MRPRTKKDLLAGRAPPDTLFDQVGSYRRRLRALALGSGLGFFLGAVPPVALGQSGRLSQDQFNLLADRLRASASFKVRLQAALLLGAAGGSDAEPLLVTALHDDNSVPVRAAAALALGQTADRRALDSLVGVLTDDDGLIRGQAEKGLTQLVQSLPSGANLFWQALSHAPDLAQLKGTAVLGQAGAGGVPGLCAAAAAGNDPVKAAARAELAKLPKNQLEAGLRATLKLRDSDVSPLAAAMLGDQGDPAVLSVLVDAMSDPTQPEAVLSAAHSALLRSSEQIDAATETRQFGSDDPQERLRAVLLLSVKGGPAAEALALRALNDSNLRVQAAGASAAADLGVTRALPEIRVLTEREEEAPILRVLQLAARRLERRHPLAP